MRDSVRSMQIEGQAERLLQELGFLSLPIDPFAIAAAREIAIQAKPDCSPGVSGMLLRHGDNFGIMYATDIKSEGFQRFSIAHELGHYFLEGHPEAVIKNGLHESRAGFTSEDIFELEADHFAASLLMPKSLFRMEAAKLKAGLDAVVRLADKCQTSLVATAIRYAQLSDDAIAAIVSEGAEVLYCFLSDRMKTLDGIDWIKRGNPVPDETATSTLNSNPRKISNGGRESSEVDIRDWLGGSRAINSTEEAIGLGTYGRTLTILACAYFSDSSSGEDDDGDEDAEEAALIKSWTPRFRR